MTIAPRLGRRMCVKLQEEFSLHLIVSLKMRALRKYQKPSELLEDPLRSSAAPLGLKMVYERMSFQATALSGQALGMMFSITVRTRI